MGFQRADQRAHAGAAEDLGRVGRHHVRDDDVQAHALERDDRILALAAAERDVYKRQQQVCSTSGSRQQATLQCRAYYLQIHFLAYLFSLLHSHSFGRFLLLRTNNFSRYGTIAFTIPFTTFFVFWEKYNFCI